MSFGDKLHTYKEMQTTKTGVPLIEPDLLWADLLSRARRKAPAALWPLIVVAPLMSGCYAPPPGPYAHGGPFFQPIPQFIPRPAPSFGGGALRPGQTFVQPSVPSEPREVPAQQPEPRGSAPAQNPAVSGGGTSGGGASWSQWASGLLPRGGGSPDQKYGWWRINGWLDRMGAAP